MSSRLPSRNISVFQGVAIWYTNLTLSCVIPLWDSATAHSPSGNKLNPSSQEDALISERCTLAYKFNFILHHSSLGTFSFFHSPSSKELNPYSQEDAGLSGRCAFNFILRHRSLGLSNNSLTLW